MSNHGLLHICRHIGNLFGLAATSCLLKVISCPIVEIPIMGTMPDVSYSITSLDKTICLMLFVHILGDVLAATIFFRNVKS